MTAPTLIKLHYHDDTEVTVNMARVLYLENGYSDLRLNGSKIRMNIPDTWLEVKETPHDIRHLTKEAMKP